MKFGKKTVTESFFNGKTQKKVLTYSIPIKVTDQSQLLSEFIKALDLITSKQSEEVTLHIKAPGYKLQSMTKEYITGEEY